MNRQTILSALVIALFSVGAAAQSTNQPSTINVTGTAELKVVPDSAVFTLSVEKIHMEMVEAKRENDESVAQILAMAKKHGIDEKDAKTDYISVSRRFEYVGTGADRRQVFKGYGVSKTVIIKLKDLKNFESFFSDVLTTGLTAVRSVYFQTSEYEKHIKETRLNAIRAAKQKAADMAGAIGQSIGKAVHISDDSGNRGASLNITANYVDTANSATTTAGTFSPGTITIRSQVDVRFLLN